MRKKKYCECIVMVVHPICASIQQISFIRMLYIYYNSITMDFDSHSYSPYGYYHWSLAPQTASTSNASSISRPKHNRMTYTVYTRTILIQTWLRHITKTVWHHQQVKPAENQTLTRVILRKCGQKNIVHSMTLVVAIGVNHQTNNICVAQWHARTKENSIPYRSARSVSICSNGVLSGWGICANILCESWIHP